MSKSASPGHGTSHFESYYDPTSEISSRMHVPDKICVIEGIEASETISSQNKGIEPMMQVPERILLAGDNKHIAVRESLPELKFETPFPSQLPSYILSAPPNILTVDEYRCPSEDLKPSKRNEVKKKSAIDQPLAEITDFNESSMSSSCAPEEEIIMLRKQVKLLSRRVLAIEQENQQHQQREIVLYALGVTYFILKGLIWLRRNF